MLRPWRERTPKLADNAWVEDSAQVIGDVELAEESSVWFNCVLRGDVEPIRIGRRTNIQDLSMIHSNSGQGFVTTIGEDCTVGHHVVLHGVRIGNRVLVGMGAVLLDGVVVGDDCLIGAGSLVTPGTVIPAGSLVMGSPARVKRPLEDRERQRIIMTPPHYHRTAMEYLASGAGVSGRTLREAAGEGKQFRAG